MPVKKSNSTTRKRKSPDINQDENKTFLSVNKKKKSQKVEHTKQPLPVKEECVEMSKYDSSLIPDRKSNGDLVFSDHPEFTPNLTPEEVIRLGSFGGTYFRAIHSNVAKRSFTAEEALEDLPKEWFTGLNMEGLVTSDVYNSKVNKYKAKCGQGLTEWESSGWITEHDPYGWFQWYCRFYLGRRCADDARQIKRGLGVMGERGRWRRYLANKCLEDPRAHHSLKTVLNDVSISPKVRQLLQHWGFALTLDALKLALK